jgi:hypothetical protein
MMYSFAIHSYVLWPEKVFLERLLGPLDYHRLLFFDDASMTTPRPIGFDVDIVGALFFCALDFIVIVGK